MNQQSRWDSRAACLGYGQDMSPSDCGGGGGQMIRSLDALQALDSSGPGGAMRGSKRHRPPEPRNDLERAFMASMAAEGLSADSQRQRIYLLRALGDPRSVTMADVVGLINGRELSPHSRAAYVAVLRTTFDDLVRLGLVDDNPLARMKTPRTPRRQPRPLSSDQLEALEGLEGTHPREWAFTILGAYAGLRAGEVGNLPGTALAYRTGGPVLRVTGKGGLVADIPAHPKVVAVMESYSGVTSPIWDMWPQSVNRAWQRAAASVGVEGVVFHQLRHTFATRLTRAGVDLLVIAEVCRHASVATTQRYAAVADEAPFAAVAGL